ncbi:MAG: ABC transporter ATP-binding protein [Gemmatimonadaceae bacterium]
MRTDRRPPVPAVDPAVGPATGLATGAGLAGTPTAAIEMRGIVKYFGPVQANRGAELEVPAGQLHALVGENGAGKSTLMRILSGMYAPDGGTVRVEGHDVTGWSTAAAIAAGVGMVHQHFMLVPTLTVAENVVLGREPRRGLRFDRARAEREVAELGERTGLVAEPGRRVADLSVGEAQRVEILKTLYRGARILILDEPTAVLSPPEVEELWRVLRRLRDQGGTVVLITHKLDEVIAVSDAITVMRAGLTVERIRTADTTPQAIARAMVGREVALAMDAAGGPDASFSGAGSAGSAGSAAGASGGMAGGTGLGEAGSTVDGVVRERGAPPENSIVSAATAPATNPPRPPSSRRVEIPSTPPRPALEVRGLTVVAQTGAGRRLVDDVTFAVAPGEIFGIAGVEGNGQTALVEAIAGLAEFSGELWLDGRQVNELDVRGRSDAGLSHIPEDRQRRGLILDFSIADNLILGRQHHFTRGPSLDLPRVAAHARAQIAAFDIRPPDPGLAASALSGGNQQKLIVGREMGRDFGVLLAAQPTRGVDVGAIEFIHHQLRNARAAGKAILLVSADLAEILALADRIAVMYRGRFAIVLPRAGASAEVLGPYMTGATGRTIDGAGAAAAPSGSGERP